ncbi:MAG: hypothetical protein QNJ46_26745 [Leptolyngbyaceae cyanobacterium MO_188.B28]|nr:hypothetical protein [Leptolyngbyaceae cyanobacterium MO_188.B28]
MSWRLDSKENTQRLERANGIARQQTRRWRRRGSVHKIVLDRAKTPDFSFKNQDLHKNLSTPSPSSRSKDTAEQRQSYL